MGKDVRTFNVSKSKSYVVVNVMSGDDDGHLSALIEYDPQNPKEEKYISDIIQYTKTNISGKKRMAKSSSYHWMQIMSIERVDDIDGDTYQLKRYRSARYAKYNIKYLTKYYVLCNSVFFYYRDESRKIFDENFAELKAIHEEFTGKKVRIPNVRLE
jgi:hypothetical protein